MVQMIYTYFFFFCQKLVLIFIKFWYICMSSCDDRQDTGILSQYILFKYKNCTFFGYEGPCHISELDQKTHNVHMYTCRSTQLSPYRVMQWPFTKTVIDHDFPLFQHLRSVSTENKKLLCNIINWKIIFSQNTLSSDALID